MTFYIFDDCRKFSPIISLLPLFSLEATVYTQIIKFSQVLTKRPLTPKIWRTRIFQSPPGTPRIGGHGGGGFRGLNRPKRKQVRLVCTREPHLKRGGNDEVGNNSITAFTVVKK